MNIQPNVTCLAIVVKTWQIDSSRFLTGWSCVSCSHVVTISCSHRLRSFNKRIICIFF